MQGIESNHDDIDLITIGQTHMGNDIFGLKMHGGYNEIPYMLVIGAVYGNSL